MSAPPDLTNAKLNIQIDPTFSGVLDKRSFGSVNNRPLYAGGGMIRYEYDNNGGTLLYHDGTDWNDVTTGGTSFPNFGYLDEDPYIYMWDKGQYPISVIWKSPSLPRWFLRFQDEVDWLQLNGSRISIRENWNSGSGESNKTMLDIVGHAVYLTSPVNFLPASGSTNVMTVTTQGVQVANLEFKVDQRLQVLANETKVQNGKLVIEGDASQLTAQGDVYVVGDLKKWDASMGEYIDVTTSMITPELLGTLDDGTPIDVNMTTNETVGGIPKGTSVATLVNDSDYNTVQKLLAKILKIGPEDLLPLVATGSYISVSYSGTGIGTGDASRDIRICTTIQNIALSIIYNRGSWSPKQTSGGKYPYGRILSVAFTEPFTNSTPTWVVPADATQDLVGSSISVTSSTFVPAATKLASTLQTYQLTSLMSAHIGAGENAYNKTLGPFSVPENLTRQMTNTITFRLYAEVFRVINDVSYLNDMTGNPGTDGYSGSSPTTRVFENTIEIFACNLDPADSLSIPYYNTFDVYQYTKFFNTFSLQPTNTYSVTSTSRDVNGITVQYYNIKFLNEGREAADIKVVITS